jgi:HEAT repeat protein
VEAYEEAEAAIRQIGTNAIPTLLKMLSKKDSIFVSKLGDLWNRHHDSLPHWARYRSYVNQAEVLNDEAVLGFEILRADAQSAAPALIKIYEQNISVYCQEATCRALNAIGPAAQSMALPSLLRAIASSNAVVRGVAFYALIYVHTEPQLVVPALAKALNETNFRTRLSAAWGLGEIGFIR